jgi:predicted RNA-binding Zn-ribbon protein involved in translation (DUF1610 family)
MDVTTMASTRSLINKLIADFPAYQFISDDNFHWSPQNKTIYYIPLGEESVLLHEIAHAILGHTEYRRDIQLIEMERDAWNYAQHTLGINYKIPIKQEIIDATLDTYRDWLHARSTCPSCNAIGIQTKKQHYKCVSCGQSWRVNDARLCGLKRYKTIKNNAL